MVKYMYGYQSSTIDGELQSSIQLTGAPPASCSSTPKSTACPTRPPGTCKFWPSTVTILTQGNNVIGCCITRNNTKSYVQVTIPPKNYQPRELVAAVNRQFACSGVPLCMTHQCKPGTLDRTTQQCEADESKCNATCQESTPVPAEKTLVSLSPMFVLNSSKCNITQITIGGSSLFHTMRAALGMGSYSPTSTASPSPFTATPSNIERQAIQTALNDRSSLVITSTQKYVVAPFIVQNNLTNVCRNMNNSRVQTSMANSVAINLNDVNATQCNIYTSQVDNDPKHPYQLAIL